MLFDSLAKPIACTQAGQISSVSRNKEEEAQVYGHEIAGLMLRICLVLLLIFIAALL